MLHQNHCLRHSKSPTELVNVKKEIHSTGKSLVLPAAFDMVHTMLCESYAKELWQIPLADNIAEKKNTGYFRRPL
jgi:hypothetical protein